MTRSNVLKITAAVVLGMTGLFWLIKSAVDLMGGVPGGDYNLGIAVIVLGLTLLSWKRMLLGGIITAAVAVILAVIFNLVLPNIQLAFIPLLLICAPLALSGLLFIEADWTSKKRD
jgi:hypothetical protein